MFPSLGPMEMAVVMLVAVLLFGKRLPEVGRSLGKGIIEFKKGLRGVEEGEEPVTSFRPRNTLDRAVPVPSSDEPYAADIPKFEPPTTAPTPRTGYEPQPYQD